MRFLRGPRIVRKTTYEGQEAILIHGEETDWGRGPSFDYAIVLQDRNIIFGSEDGNYAGGNTLTPLHDDYEQKKIAKLQSIKEHEIEFYNLIARYLNQ